MDVAWGWGALVVDLHLHTVPICDCYWMRPIWICARHFSCNPSPWIRWQAVAFLTILSANYLHPMALSHSWLSDACFLRTKCDVNKLQSDHTFNVVHNSIYFVRTRHTMHARTHSPTDTHTCTQLTNHKFNWPNTSPNKFQIDRIERIAAVIPNLRCWPNVWGRK